MLATKASNVEAARQLIQYGADLNITNIYGNSPYSYVKDYKNIEDRVDFVRLYAVKFANTPSNQDQLKQLLYRQE